jgi:hypothetical protein
MSDLLVLRRVSQGTSAPTTNPLIYVNGPAYQGTSLACLVDTVPPTFGGIASLSLQSFGQIRATWLPAVDPSGPIRYEIYIKANDNINLFYAQNLVAITDKLLADIFTLPNGVLISGGVTYHLGVRAVDVVGNRETNGVSLSIESTGISSSGTSEYQTNGVFSINEDGELIATLWATINEEIVNAPGRLGTASYVIYDRDGNLVPLMTETGIVADSNGQYQITPIVSTLILTANFYVVKATIVVDGQPRNNFLPIVGMPGSEDAGGAVVEPRAVFSINASNQLQGSLWITRDGERINLGLGTASFSIYDKDGIAIGINQTGLTADANGVYKTTAVSALAIQDLTHYYVTVSITLDSVIKTNIIGLMVEG